MDNNSTGPIQFRDTAKGKQHRFFDAQGVDELVSISMALAQELWVVKERQLALEQAAAKQGVVVKDVTEHLSPDALAKLDAERAGFIDRIFFVLREQSENLEDRDDAVS